ncbi:MAG: hypothetical protein ACI83D_000669, partial [Planctomycetota bacterium]
PLQYIFVCIGAAVLLGLIFSTSLKDTKCTPPKKVEYFEQIQ